MSADLYEIIHKIDNILLRVTLRQVIINILNVNK